VEHLVLRIANYKLKKIKVHLKVAGLLNVRGR
jgi:hypothetical protein